MSTFAPNVFPSRCFIQTQVARRRLSPKRFCTMSGHRQIEGVAQEVLGRLVEKKVILTTVESCTGGLLAHIVTNVGGAAQVFWGSVVTYDGSFKRVWGVQSSCILEFPGTVSEQAAQEMAEGGLRNMMSAVTEQRKCSDLVEGDVGAALSVTGFAGAAPQECDNGLCYIALAMTGQKTHVKKLNAEGDDRKEHKDYFAREAFNLLLEHL